jgi:ribosomal protein S25
VESEGPRISVEQGKGVALHATNPSEKSAEQQILEVIEECGKITPAQAALKTTLTVAEADRLLSQLAQEGHLELQVEGGKLVYSL